MKKIRLKRWVRIALKTIMLVSLMLLSAEVKDLTLFVLSKIILLIIAILSANILIENGEF